MAAAATASIIVRAMEAQITFMLGFLRLLLFRSVNGISLLRLLKSLLNFDFCNDCSKEKQQHNLKKKMQILFAMPEMAR